MIETHDGGVILTAEEAKEVGTWCARAMGRIRAYELLVPMITSANDRHVGLAMALERAVDFIVGEDRDEEAAQEAAKDIKAIMAEHGWDW